MPNHPEFTADVANGADKIQPDRDGGNPMNRGRGTTKHTKGTKPGGPLGLVSCFWCVSWFPLDPPGK